VTDTNNSDTDNSLLWVEVRIYQMVFLARLIYLFNW